MSYVHIIAIDGTAGSGKSTLGHKLAEKMGYVFLDTGLLYRAITRHVVDSEVQPDDVCAIIKYAESLTVTIEQLQPEVIICVNGDRVTNLYTPQINDTVPIVAAYPEIREKVRETQRQIAKRGKVILAGRDIGTVVLPLADLKIFLEVTLEERAKRRYSQQNNAKQTLDEIKESIRLRDIADATREASPMRPAGDAIIITTDGLSLDDIVGKVLNHAQIE